MASVAVDFAKHGESVAPENYRDIQKFLNSENPDFMERANHRKDTYASKGVLGQLYRDINGQEAIRLFMCNDFVNAIKLMYKMDENILGLVGKDLKNIEVMHSYLPICFNNIVIPMQHRLKKIMSEFQICCEGQLFACNLQFRLCIHEYEQDKKVFYLGDPGNKQEDSIKNLNCLRRAVTDDFQAEFDKIVSEGL